MAAVIYNGAGFSQASASSTSATSPSGSAPAPDTRSGRSGVLPSGTAPTRGRRAARGLFIGAGAAGAPVRLGAGKSRVAVVLVASSSGGGPAPSCPQIHLSSLTAHTDRLVVVFDDTLLISGDALDPAKYRITTSDGQAATVTRMESTGATLTLFVTRHTDGANYILTLPSLGIQSDTFAPFYGPFTVSYTGVEAPVGLQIIRVIDARALEVVFTDPPIEEQALDSANYSVSPPLAVLGVTKISDFVYTVQTEKQVPGTAYDLTVQDIFS